MATRQIVVTRPVRTLDKYKTEKKSSCFGFSSKGLQETCEVNTSSSSHRTINTSIKKKATTTHPTSFLGCIAPHLPPPPFFLCKLHHTWVSTLNAEVQVLPTSYNYEQRIITSFYSDNFSLIIHERREANID